MADWDPFGENSNSAPPAQPAAQTDFFAAFDAQPAAAPQQSTFPDMSAMLAPAANAGGGNGDLFAAMNTSAPQSDMFASVQSDTSSAMHVVSPGGASASVAAGDPFLSMSISSPTAAPPAQPAQPVQATPDNDLFAANFSMAAPSSAPSAAAPAAASSDPFADMFGGSGPATEAPSSAPSSAPAPAAAPPQPAATDFDQIFTANANAPLSPTPATHAAAPASGDDPFAMFGGGGAAASSTSTAPPPLPAQPSPAATAASTATSDRKRIPSQEDLFASAFGGQTLFAGSPTAKADASGGPPAKPPPPAPGASGQAGGSAWDPFSGGGGGGGDGLVDLGPDRSAVNCLDVAQGQRKDSMMWSRLEKLAALAPAAALDVLEHGEDAAGMEARAVSQISAEAIKSGSGKEPDGGAARLTAAIRLAEEGSREALMKCRSLQDKKVALDAAIRLSNRDTVLLVVLWLRETLKYDLFMDEISLRPRAVRIYAEYMRDTWRWEQLETFFVSVRAVELVRFKDRPQLQRTDAAVELAFCMIRRALSKESPDAQIAVLKEVCDYSRTVPRGTLWETSELEVVAGWCSDWTELTRREAEVEKTDVSLASKAVADAQRAPDLSNLGTSSEAAVPLFTRFPRSCVIGNSVLEFMQYLALYHANAREDQISSPKGLKKAFTISEKLFWFAAFQSLAKVGLWDVVRRATESKSMFTTKATDKSPIGWRPLFNLVFEYGDALKDADLRRLATHFANHMEDRLEAHDLCVAKTLWEGAIQACVDMRDEDRLIDLRVHIATEEKGDMRPYIQMIDDVYKDTRIKWKTDASTTANKVFGSKTLAGITSMFSKKPTIDTSSKSGISNMFSKKPAPKPQTSPTQHEPQREGKSHVVFGGGPGGLVEDD